MKRLFIVYLLMLLGASVNFAYGQITKERQVEDDGYVWYKVKNGKLTGAEDINGNTILPTIYKYVLYRGDICYGRKSNQKGIFVVTHTELGDKKTNYGYFAEFKAVYNLNGECIIPFDRGYSDIVPTVQKSASKPKLWYKFSIDTGGVNIEGICNTEGKEIWRRVAKHDYRDVIEYSDTYGFYYDSNTGERVKLNVFLSSSDFAWNTSISKAKSLTYCETLNQTPQEWQLSKDGKYRKLHSEPDGTKWFEVKTAPDAEYIAAEDYYGNLIISNDSKAYHITYNASNYIRGIYITAMLIMDYNTKGEFLGSIAEAYTKEGNIIIPKSREYSSIRISKNGKFLAIQGRGGVGVCDLNGYEVVPPLYSEYTYDGYDFEGIRTDDGKKVLLTIHKRPTPPQQKQVKEWGGYYCNTPWLLMPGPQYTPTYDIWSAPQANWNNIPIFGGVGDYVPTHSTDPCVNAAIQVKNSTQWLREQGVNVSPTNSDSSSSSRKCHHCNGTGRKAVNQGVATFGLSDSRVYCNECGQYFHQSTGHSHITCGQCGGTGYQR